MPRERFLLSTKPQKKVEKLQVRVPEDLYRTVDDMAYEIITNTCMTGAADMSSIIRLSLRLVERIHKQYPGLSLTRAVTKEEALALRACSIKYEDIALERTWQRICEIVDSGIEATGRYHLRNH